MQEDSSTAMAAAGGTKKKMLATLVGCNYAGKKGIELQGSINGVHAMRAVLLDRFGFAPADVTVLTDDDDDPEKLPTGAAIRGALDDMVKRAASGDVLFFYFSGHGLRSDYADGPGGGVDHLIAPCDFEFISDLYLRELVDRVPAGATFTMVADSNQSGGLIDQEKEQIGPAAASGAGTADSHLHAGARARRFLPYAASSGLGASPHIADHLVAPGDDAIATRTDDAGILLSACQKDQLSAEFVPRDGGKAYGFFTWALLTVLAADPAPMSNHLVVRRAREVMSEKRIAQHPCLYCSDAHADAPFLGQQDTKAKNN